MLSLRDMTKRLMIGNLDIPLIIVMKPNIKTWDKTSRKRVTETRTNSGWADIHWGNERDIIACSGLTASRIGNENMYRRDNTLGTEVASYVNSITSGSGTDAQGPKQWANIERAMLKLEQIYKLDQERIGSLGEVVSSSVSRVKKIKSIFSSDKPESELSLAIKGGYAKRAQSFLIYNYCIYWGYFTDFRYNEDVDSHPRQYAFDFTFKVIDSSTDWLSHSMIANFPEARILNFFTQVPDAVTYAANMVTNADKMLKAIFI